MPRCDRLYLNRISTEVDRPAIAAKAEIYRLSMQTAYSNLIIKVGP